VHGGPAAATHACLLACLSACELAGRFPCATRGFFASWHAMPARVAPLPLPPSQPRRVEMHADIMACVNEQREWDIYGHTYIAQMRKPSALVWWHTQLTSFFRKLPMQRSSPEPNEQASPNAGCKAAGVAAAVAMQHRKDTGCPLKEGPLKEGLERDTSSTTLSADSASHHMAQHREETEEGNVGEVAASSRRRTGPLARVPVKDGFADMEGLNTWRVGFRRVDKKVSFNDEEEKQEEVAEDLKIKQCGPLRTSPKMDDFDSIFADEPSLHRTRVAASTADQSSLQVRPRRNLSEHDASMIMKDSCSRDTWESLPCDALLSLAVDVDAEFNLAGSSSSAEASAPEAGRSPGRASVLKKRLSGGLA